MTEEELNKAVDKLISEANEESEAAKAEYEEACRSIRFRLLERRAYRSSILENALDALKEEYDGAVLKIQSDLDESLEALYAEEGGGGSPGEGIDPDDAPYEVDYTLPMRDRYVAVKNYYLGIENEAQALAALQEDEIAKDYLGTYYDYLLQLLLMLQQ